MLSPGDCQGPTRSPAPGAWGSRQCPLCLLCSHPPSTLRISGPHTQAETKPLPVWGRDAELHLSEQPHSQTRLYPAACSLPAPFTKGKLRHRLGQSLALSPKSRQ